MSTVLYCRNRFDSVFLFERNSRTTRAGAKRSSRAAGAMERIVCSKRRVKSKLERHPWTTGPNTSSLMGRQEGEAMTLPRCLHLWFGIQFYLFPFHSKLLRVPTQTSECEKGHKNLGMWVIFNPRLEITGSARNGGVNAPDRACYRLIIAG